MKYRILETKNALGQTVYVGQRKVLGLFWQNLPAFWSLEFNSNGELGDHYTFNKKYNKHEIEELIEKYINRARRNKESREKNKKENIILSSKVIKEYE